MHKLETIQEAVRFIQARVSFTPSLGIVLGTGLSGFADDLVDKQEIPYRLIPHFVESTVAGHAGKLVFGKLNGIKTVMMAGRFHYYEGYSLEQVTFPMRVMKYLGIDRMIITNVSGSLQPTFKAGDILIVNDHINQIPSSPLRGPNDERIGPRFPDLTKPYDEFIIKKAKEITVNQGITAHEGVYIAVSGPHLETKAERIYMQKLGADAVGMSTVPEVIVCNHMNLPVNVFSIISNEFNVETSVEEVISVAKASESKLRSLIVALTNVL